MEYLYDIESDLLNEIAFSIHINRIDKLNKELHRKGEDKRASYTTLSDFVKWVPINKQYQKCIKDAKVFIRKDKIEKIINEI